MDWEDAAISELYQRFESIYRGVDKVVYPGVCNAPSHHTSTWPMLNCGIAYLSGGTDRFGSPIIYIPHNTKLADVTEGDFREVIKYLVAATNASSADVGFVVLIDSRQSRWNTLAWILRNVATSFPGELKMILALRPSSILHGTLSTIAMRYQKDEYNYKVPIELLSCVESIWPWIAKSALPRELGGMNEYEHSTWLKKRQMIETLASMLKQAIKRCKSYSVELINEQLFPDTICQEVVSQQDKESESVMAQVESINREGQKILLDDIWQSEFSDNDVISAGVKDIKHLRSLIWEVKDTFGNFWKTYEAKRAGFLHLKSFEKNYKNAASRISCLIENLEFETGKTELTPVHNAVARMDMPHYSSQEATTDLCLRACVDGEGLMRDHPYAIDCIKPKCEELKRLSQCFQNLMEEKLQNDILLQRTKEIIREVNEWSNAGMKLLSVQNLEKAKSSQGLIEALEELGSYTSTSDSLKVDELRKYKAERNHALEHITISLEESISQFDLVFELFEKRKVILNLHSHAESSSNITNVSENTHEDGKNNGENKISLSRQENTAIVHPMPQNGSDLSVLDDEYKLRQVINELLETEKKYVEELNEIVEGYGHSIDDPSMQEFIPEGLKENKNSLLGNLEEILHLHRNDFLPKMIECGNDEIEISNLFVQKASEFSLYYEYCHDSARRKILRKQIGETHPFFVECQRKLSHRLPLSAFLLKPVQRITKYQLLLQQIQKYSRNSESDLLKKAVESMMGVLRELNDSMHEISITGFQDDFSTLGRLQMQGSFHIQMEYKRPKVKDFAKSKFNKSLLRHLFLYENGLLICKKRDTSENETENGKIGPKIKTSDVHNSYQFKRCIKTNQISLTEVVKGCPRKFKVHCRDDDAELIITSPCNSLKQNWVKSIQNCISQQRKNNSNPGSPHKVSTPRKRIETSSVGSKTSTEPKRRSKVQRSKSWGKNSTLTSSKFLERKSSFASSEKNSKQISKIEKPIRVKENSRKSSEEVTFGNIHGVDGSPSAKEKGIADSAANTSLAVLTSKHSSLRKKKTKNLTK